VVGPGKKRIGKLQRWLDLIAFLVGHRYPVTVDQIMEAVPAYALGLGGDQVDDESVRRMFERDKDELREHGIPIETVAFSVQGGDQAAGYRLARRDFYLPYLRLIGGSPPSGVDAPRGIDILDFRPDEMRSTYDALSLAAAWPSFPLREEARSALRKLAFDLGPAAAEATLTPERPDAAQVRERLRALHEALRIRKRVRFRYHGIHRGRPTDRDVAPYGLLFQGGRWYLIGHDALRDDLRVFRLDRIETLEVNRKAEKTPDYDVPADFDLDAYRNRRPWELGGDDEPPLEARVRFHFPVSLWAERNALGRLVEEEKDGASVRCFAVHQVDPFLRWILSLSGDAEVLDPPELRSEHARLVESVAALYGVGG
jgi:predicted DNA-binding transcriptional regulator YafY